MVRCAAASGNSSGYFRKTREHERGKDTANMKRVLISAQRSKAARLGGARRKVMAKSAQVCCLEREGIERLCVCVAKARERAREREFK